jgi:hypothetical protein
VATHLAHKGLLLEECNAAVAAGSNVMLLAGTTAAICQLLVCSHIGCATRSLHILSFADCGWQRASTCLTVSPHSSLNLPCSTPHLLAGPVPCGALQVF